MPLPVAGSAELLVVVAVNLQRRRGCHWQPEPGARRSGATASGSGPASDSETQSRRRLDTV
jgi:hypothetical protein